MDQLSAMRAFVRVAESGSFSAAARAFNTTQATISKRVAALEDLLGVKLLIRSSRDQALTEAGEEYLQRAIQILDAVDDAEMLARCQTDAPRGLLRITASMDFGRRILSPLLREFMQLYPDIRVDLMLSNYQLDLISSGIDVAIRAGQFEDSSLISRALGRMPLCVVATPAYLRQHGRPGHPSELADHECLLYSLSTNPRRWFFDEDGRTISVLVNGKFQCDDGDAILDMVLADQGISMMPFWMMHHELHCQQLEVILAEFTLPAVAMRMVYPDRKHLPLKTRTFLDFMAAQANEHPAFDVERLLPRLSCVAQ